MILFIVVIYLTMAFLPGLFLGCIISAFAKDGQSGFLASIIGATLCAGAYCYYAVTQMENFFPAFFAVTAALTVTTLLGFWLGRRVSHWLNAD